MNMLVDLTPTWGEVGTVVRRLAMSGEYVALRKIWPEAAKAFAAAQALQEVLPLLTDDQKLLINKAMALEMGKQGC